MDQLLGGRHSKLLLGEKWKKRRYEKIKKYIGEWKKLNIGKGLSCINNHVLHGKGEWSDASFKYFLVFSFASISPKSVFKINSWQDAKKLWLTIFKKLIEYHQKHKFDYKNADQRRQPSVALRNPHILPEKNVKKQWSNV